MSIRKVLSSAFALISLLYVSVADASDFDIGYQRMAFDAAGSSIGPGYPGNSIRFYDPNTLGKTSGNMNTFFVQWNFSKWFGVLYAQSRASGLALVIEPGSSLLPANGTISGETYSFEGRYEAAGYLDWFARVNFSDFEVSGDYSGTSAFTPPVHHVSISDSQTYLSGGLRLKFTQHMGAEVIYHNFSSLMDPAFSVGLYARF